ncbi:MAG: hypothetical protein AAF282_10035 [Cyanobacteria bacterium P01_A01_bin.15]
MVNASGHIEQQLSKLQKQTADIATDLESLVDSYLQVLSQASKRQLVLTAYHVCTQIYPDKFLDLSLSQRHTLQQQLRDLGNRIQSQLNDKWDTAKNLSLRPAEEDGLAVIRQLFLEAASAREQTYSEDPEPPPAPPTDENTPDDDLERPSVTQDSQYGSSSEEMPPPTAVEHPQEKLLAEIRTLISSPDTEEPINQPEASGPMQPAQLMRRQILIEKAIRDVLKAVSEKANDILQKANVMPEIPQALLTAAAESERLGHTPMKTPNLVRLSIKVLHEPDKDELERSSDEADQKDSADKAESEQWSDEADDMAAAIITEENASVTASDESVKRGEMSASMPRLLQLDSLPDFVIIHLRLSEIEFAETNVAVWRSRIRKKMAHLKQVGHSFKDAERQLAIAQAEDAWRASWTND